MICLKFLVALLADYFPQQLGVAFINIKLLLFGKETRFH